MRTFITRPRLAVAALTACAAAGSLALGIGPAQAAPAGPASGLSWHQITTKNGWVSGQSMFGTGNPAWAVKNGVVYLSGSVRQPSGTNDAVGVLPPQARPAHASWMTVSTENDTSGSLLVLPTGVIKAWGGDATGLTSLAAVSFPARSMPQHALGLLNGWHSEQSRWNSGNPSYAVSGGVVYLSGSLAGGSTPEFAVLPAAARPKSREYVTVYTKDGSFGDLEINTNGVIDAYGTFADGYTSLAGVDYLARSAAPITLSLLNGWFSQAAHYGSGTAAFWVKNGVVHLSGSLGTNLTNTWFATLPPTARPKHPLFITIYTYGDSQGTLLITPQGTMRAYSPDASDAENFTSLASVSFPVGS